MNNFNNNYLNRNGYFTVKTTLFEEKRENGLKTTTTEIKFIEEQPTPEPEPIPLDLSKRSMLLSISKPSDLCGNNEPLDLSLKSYK